MDRIFLENFRCFHEEQTARLAPLTLLVGENSTGKTSFLALIRALWEAAYGGRSPDFKEAPYDLGSFDDIAHFRGGRAGRADHFEAGFAIFSEKRRGAVVSPKRFDIKFENKMNAPIPVKIRLTDEERNLWVEYDHPRGKSFRCSVSTPRGCWFRDEPEKSLIYDILQFNVVWLPTMFRSKPEWKTISGSSDSPGSEDWDMIDYLHLNFYISAEHPDLHTYASAPIRSRPRRTYEQSRINRDAEGDYIPMYLASMRFQDEPRWKGLRKEIESFGQMAGLFDELLVRPLGNKPSDPFQLQIRKGGRKSKGSSRNLIDVGYGVSQALPVVTELLHRKWPICLLQQPEVHLHPSAQAALGSLFCQIAEPERRIVVETHSDYLLDRVRMDVRDGKGDLKPEDVSILFFERGDLDVRIHSLGLDGNGNVLGAPPGYRDFFKAEARRSLGL